MPAKKQQPKDGELTLGQLGQRVDLDLRYTPAHNGTFPALDLSNLSPVINELDQAVIDEGLALGHYISSMPLRILELGVTYSQTHGKSAAYVQPIDEFVAQMKVKRQVKTEDFNNRWIQIIQAVMSPSLLSEPQETEIKDHE